MFHRVTATLSRVLWLGFGAELRTLLKLAAPIAVSQMALGLFGMVDTAVVGRHSREAMAATALGNSYVQVVSLFTMGLLLGLDPIFAQRLGAGEPHGAWRAFKRGSVLAVVLFPLSVLPLGLIDIFLLRPNLGTSSMFGELPNPFPTDPEVARQAIAYMWWRAPGILGFLLFTVFRAWLFAQRSSGAMIISISLANVLNLALDWVLVLGDPGLERIGLPAVGLPVWGATGAAIATSVCNLAMAALLIPGILRVRRAEVAAHPNPEPEGPSFKDEARLFMKLGLPIGSQITLEMGIFAYVLWVMAGLGTIEAGAHQIAIMVASFTFLATVGIGAAASVEVGRFIGASRTDLARKAGIVAIVAGAGWMTLSGLVLFVFPDAIARIFTDDVAVTALAADLLRIAAVFQIVDGIQSVSSGALRGAGDTRIPFLANFVAYWLIALPVARWLAFGADLGARGLWWGLTVGLAVVAMLLAARFLVLTRSTIVRV